MTTKIIVTNLVVLKQKYGSGLTQIRNGIKALIAADKGRSIQTRLADLSSATAMKRFKAKKVSSPVDPKQNKDAIDAIYRNVAPEYIVLLGAIDVIPHQDLRNPVYGSDDPDEFAYGDLPYACEAPYSRRVQDFIGSTRVVGRIPDVTGATDPTYLVKLLDVATKWKSRAFADYTRYLGRKSFFRSRAGQAGRQNNLLQRPGHGIHPADDGLAGNQATKTRRTKVLEKNKSRPA